MGYLVSYCTRCAERINMFATDLKNYTCICGLKLSMDDLMENLFAETEKLDLIKKIRDRKEKLKKLDLD